MRYKNGKEKTHEMTQYVAWYSRNGFCRRIDQWQTDRRIDRWQKNRPVTECNKIWQCLKCRKKVSYSSVVYGSCHTGPEKMSNLIKINKKINLFLNTDKIVHATRAWVNKNHASAYLLADWFLWDIYIRYLGHKKTISSLYI